MKPTSQAVAYAAELEEQSSNFRFAARSLDKSAPPDLTEARKAELVSGFQNAASACDELAQQLQAGKELTSAIVTAIRESYLRGEIALTLYHAHLKTP